MNYCKLGPGPAAVNLREGQITEQHHQQTQQGNRLPRKFFTKSGKFGRERRYIGQPSINYENPAPGEYHE